MNVLLKAVLIGLIIVLLIHFLDGLYYEPNFIIGGNNWFIDYINNDYCLIGGL